MPTLRIIAEVDGASPEAQDAILAALQTATPQPGLPTGREISAIQWRDSKPRFYVWEVSWKSRTSPERTRVIVWAAESKEAEIAAFRVAPQITERTHCETQVVCLSRKLPNETTVIMSKNE